MLCTSSAAPGICISRCKRGSVSAVALCGGTHTAQGEVREVAGVVHVQAGNHGVLCAPGLRAESKWVVRPIRGRRTKQKRKRAGQGNA